MIAKMMTALCVLIICATAMVIPQSPSITRRAIELSKRANVDPSFAEEACKLWAIILDTDCDGTTDGQMPLPLGAMPAAHALHASTLVRIGRDKEAMVEYQKSLDFLTEGGALSKTLSKEEAEIRMGMGKSLQRMLRYRDATDVFLGVAGRCVGFNANVASRNEENLGWIKMVHCDSVLRAALCCTRSGDLESAISILEKFEGHDAEIDGMHGALLLMQMHSFNSHLKDMTSHNMSQIAKNLLHDASNKSLSPLYSWIYLTSQLDRRDKISDEPFLCIEGDIYLSFAIINNSLDDPGLINLDDKILLHSTVMDSFPGGKDFWSLGYILPKEYDSFLKGWKRTTDNKKRKAWILKERSGYGSHGNTIVSTDEVNSIYCTSKVTEPILCQRLIDPPMLLDGRKFSLRIYVVYFPGGNILSNDGEETIGAEIHISTEGLVKYASALFEDGETKSNTNILDDQYMTNSGRGDGRTSQQHDLKQLQRDFRRNGINYNHMWGRIERSIQIVMKRYIHLQNEESLDANAESSPGCAFANSKYPALCGIPKILGFDYILDSSTNPFLLEINRFPGLEPRSSMDADVKHTVVYDAWVAASNRMGVPKEYFRRLRPINYKGFSLKTVPLS